MSLFSPNNLVFSTLRIRILKYIKQKYCQLCYMVVKYGLLHLNGEQEPEANIWILKDYEWEVEKAS
jgi:hypothetical protein